MKKKLMTWLLTFVMAATIFGMNSSIALAAGSGTEEDPYLISSAEEFAAMVPDKGTCYKLAADITVSTPYASDFAGHFDGDGHTITLAIENDTTYTALFKNLIAGAVVENLTTAGSVTVSGNRSYAGCIVGKATGAADGDPVLIKNCLNKASMNGYKAVGGIAGWCMTNVTIEGCVNTGAITGANNQVGGIVGNLSTGVGNITNCYNTGAVTGFNQAGGIIGLPTKSSAYDTLTNCYDTGICTLTSTNTSVGSLSSLKSNNGVMVNCYALDTAAANAIPAVTDPEGVTVKTADEMKAADFVTALGDAYAADTQGINDGYPILTWQAADEPVVDPADQEKADAIVSQFDSEYNLKPSFGTDTNINQMVKDKVSAYTIDGLEADKISVALKSTDEPDNIATDGTITYVKKDALNAYIYSLNAKCEFTITYGTASADTKSKTAIIGWDRDAFFTKMQGEAEGLTADSIKGENESLDNVTAELSLPQIMGTSAQKVWSVITWTSSNEDVIHTEEVQYGGLPTPLKGVVTPAENDTEVTLTATFKANDTILNSNVEKQSDFQTVEKTFTVTVPGTGPVGPTEEELQALLDKYYTAEALKKFEDQSQLDPSNVTGDIQLILYTRINDEEGNPVFENKEIKVESSDESVIKINGYRGAVDRFQEENKTVDLIISFTRNNITVQKRIPVTVVAITDAELDKEIAALEAVKDHYFDGINDGRYADANSITGDLHPFQEANVSDDGTVSFVYNYNDMTNMGIVPDGYFEDSTEMEQAGYNRYKSSVPAVIGHENLVLTMPEEETEVTITSWLSSDRYGDLAPAHPDNEKLQKLYKQEVSVTVKVVPPHTHQMVHHDAVSPTADEDGNIEYWQCAKCGKYFEDEAGTVELTEKDVILPKTGGNESTEPEKTTEPTTAKPKAKGSVISAKAGSFKVTSSSPKNPTVELKKGKNAASVTVPTTITSDGVKYKVTSIAPKAYYNCKKLKKVVVGSNIIKIGKMAFGKCPNLKTVTIGKNVKTIGAKCFAGDKKLKGLILKTKKLTKAGVKKSLAGSSIKTIKVKAGSKKVNKKTIKKYKKIFAKKNSGRKAKVK